MTKTRIYFARDDLEAVELTLLELGIDYNLIGVGNAEESMAVSFDSNSAAEAALASYVLITTASSL